MNRIISKPRNDRIVLALSAGAVVYAALLASYVHEKAKIIDSVGGTHVGSDVIALVYVASGLAIAACGAAVVLALHASRRLIIIGAIALVSSVGATGWWTYLHLTKRIVSHGAMMQGH